VNHAARTSHPVYRVMNRPLTIWGIDRGLFAAVALSAAGTFQLSTSLLSGLAVFVLLYLAIYSISQYDPQMLRLLFASSRWHKRYDPFKYEPTALTLLEPTDETS
jgi:type IV secretory pathway VirB3-like protein